MLRMPSNFDVGLLSKYDQTCISNRPADMLFGYSDPIMLALQFRQGRSI